MMIDYYKRIDERATKWRDQYDHCDYDDDDNDDDDDRRQS